MGAQAAEMLIKRINLEKMEVTHKKLPVSFVERQTTRRKAEKT
jgi:LacI family transcriptional regulator